MKQGISLKNAVEIDSLQVYFQIYWRVCKNFYIWFVKPICFSTPKLHFATLLGSQPIVWEALS